MTKLRQRRTFTTWLAMGWPSSLWFDLMRGVRSSGLFEQCLHIPSLHAARSSGCCATALPKKGECCCVKSGDIARSLVSCLEFLKLPVSLIGSA